MLLEELRAQVLETAQRMVSDGLAHGAQGNVSALDRESGYLAITPSAIPYDEMRTDDVCVIDVNGKLIEGSWKPTSETPMHTLFYRERSDIGAVVHSHAPYSTVFAIIDEPIPVVVIETAACIGDHVRVAPYYQPGTEELGRIALDTMGDGVAVLLANHGLLSIGDNLAQAYDATIAAETTARLVIMARSMNAVPITLPREIVASMREGYLHHYKRSASS
jgi:ribulose-5-phosphate 4-epimerase/fuculose-1-phosphate aldolase